jgi:uncharacterized protein (DUF362 family)
LAGKVAISRVSNIEDASSVAEAVGRAVGMACDFEALVRGRKVVLKPNVFCPLPPPVTTDPRVISALIRLCRDAGAAQVTVAEGRSISTAKFRKSARTTRECFQATGMDKAAEEADSVVYLEDDEFVPVPVPNGVVLKELSVPRTIAEAEVLINVPVLKNHSLTLVTLGIKNLHGVVSDADKLFGHSYHKIPSKLVDILKGIRPALTVIDGVRGLEGDHSDMGTSVDFGAIFAGTDTVACDAVASAAIGLDPMEVDMTRIADEQGVGTGRLSDIKVVGESIESVRRVFRRPDIEILESRFPGLKVAAGEYCRGCEYYIRRGIDRLVEADILDPKDPITLVFGKDPRPPEHPQGRVIIIGDCALSSDSVKRLRNELFLDDCLKIVYCCPPMEFRMRAIELAGD